MSSPAERRAALSPEQCREAEELFEQYLLRVDRLESSSRQVLRIIVLEARRLLTESRENYADFGIALAFMAEIICTNPPLL